MFQIRSKMLDFPVFRAQYWRFAVLYALNKDLLSKAPQYDWGMRAIKSVLVVAGAMKRADPDLPEQAVLPTPPTHAIRTVLKAGECIRHSI